MLFPLPTPAAARSLRWQEEGGVVGPKFRAASPDEIGPPERQASDLLSRRRICYDEIGQRTVSVCSIVGQQRRIDEIAIDQFSLKQCRLCRHKS